MVPSTETESKRCISHLQVGKQQMMSAEELKQEGEKVNPQM